MNLSALVLPSLLSLAAVWGMGRRVNVFGALTHGAEEGLTVLLRIIPALVGLLTAVSMFRASGAMEWFSDLCAPVLELLGIPAQTAPLMLVPHLYAQSLFWVGVLVLIVWEVRYRRHPERFWSGSNRTLQCSQCQEKLCRYKNHLYQIKPPQE